MTIRISSRRQSHKLSVWLILIFGSLTATHTPAATLWYNGNFDSRSALSNEVNTQVNQSNVYDDFVVPAAQTWTITGVFSNDLMNFISNSAEWEIRSSVSLNNGGVLIASGTGADTQQAVGSGLGLTEYNVQVSGLSITLMPGTYWLSVAPIHSGSGRSFIPTTSGAGCVGVPCGNDGNSYWTNAQFGENFGDPADALGPGTWDFSMGVIGTVATPEPASLGLLGSGIIGVLVVALSPLRLRGRVEPCAR